jgi:hypothetical protein
MKGLLLSDNCRHMVTASVGEPGTNVIVRSNGTLKKRIERTKSD